MILIFLKLKSVICIPICIPQDSEQTGCLGATKGFLKTWGCRGASLQTRFCFCISIGEPRNNLFLLISAQFTSTGYHELFAASYRPYLCPGWVVARIPKSSYVPGCSGCVQRQLQGRVSTTRSQTAAAKLYELLFQIPDSAGLKQPEVLKVPLVRAIFPLAGGSQTQKSVRISGFP